MRKPRPTLRITPLVAAASCLSAVCASAQEVSDAREGNAWIGYVVAAVLVLLVAVVSFLGTKRSHEDT